MAVLDYDGTLAVLRLSSSAAQRGENPIGEEEMHVDIVARRVASVLNLSPCSELWEGKEGARLGLHPCFLLQQRMARTSKGEWVLFSLH
jgi:hypothetical protein